MSLRCVAVSFRKLGQRLLHPIHQGLDKTRVIVEDANLVHNGGARSGGLLRACDVLTILPAARVRTIRRSHKGQRPAYAVLLHLQHGVSQQGVPVAIAPVNRQARSILGKFGLERRDQSPVLFVDRALAAEVVIVLRHLQHALTRHVLSAQDVFQERHYVRGAFGAAEGCYEYRVVVHRFVVRFVTGSETTFATLQGQRELLRCAGWDSRQCRLWRSCPRD